MWLGVEADVLRKSLEIFASLSTLVCPPTSAVMLGLLTAIGIVAVEVEAIALLIRAYVLRCFPLLEVLYRLRRYAGTSGVAIAVEARR